MIGLMAPIDWTRRADELAPLVLGGVLRHGQVRVRISEVEAYLGPDDPASHAFRGPRGRASTMFGAPGRLYVYLSYGIHVAANLVCSPPGQASALLLRAGEVLAGVDEAEVAARGVQLASGPGRLGRVLGLRLADDGAVLGAGDFDFTPAIEPIGEFETGPRVGISMAADWPLRFWLAGDPTVSRYGRSPRAPQVGNPGKAGPIVPHLPREAGRRTTVSANPNQRRIGSDNSSEVRHGTDKRDH